MLPVVPLVARRQAGELIVDLDGLGRVQYVVTSSPEQAPPNASWADAQGEVRLAVAELPDRPYLHLRGADGRSRVVGERLVPLQGARNFRDLGGYPTAEGGSVRWGQAFRSDHLGALTATDVERIAALGIRTVVDYRGQPERDEHPSKLPAGVIVHHLPIAEELAEQTTPLDRIRAGEITSWTVEDMTELYLGILERHAATFARVLTWLADPHSRPLLFHCAGGKDRTGLTAALVLSVLGVPRDHVLADFELTNLFRSEERLAGLRTDLEAAGVDVDALATMFIAPRPALEASLEELERSYGGPVEYLRRRGGLAAETVDALRRELVAG